MVKSIFHSWRKMCIHWVLLVLVCAGESPVIGSPGPIRVLAGDDVTLPCSLNKSVSPEDLILEWSRPDLTPKYVHVYRHGQDLPDRNPSYEHRTALFKDKLKNGNVSLKLSRVRLGDEGSYVCSVSQVKIQVIQLIVGAGPLCPPEISILELRDGRAVLRCESKTWYPHPHVEWLGSEGTSVLPGQSKQTENDTDGHHTVRSTVAVKETRTNRFLCRVHLEKINHTQQTEIHIPGDIFKTEYDCSVIIGFAVAFAAMMAVMMAVFIYCCLKHKCDTPWSKSDTGAEPGRREQHKLAELAVTIQRLTGEKEELQRQLSTQQSQNQEQLANHGEQLAALTRGNEGLQGRPSTHDSQTPTDATAEHHPAVQEERDTVQNLPSARREKLRSLSISSLRLSYGRSSKQDLTPLTDPLDDGSPDDDTTPDDIFGVY